MVRICWNSRREEDLAFALRACVRALSRAESVLHRIDAPEAAAAHAAVQEAISLVGDLDEGSR